MTNKINKLQDIYNKLTHLLFQFKNTYVGKLNDLPNYINRIVVGENRIPLYLNGNLEEVTKDDLKGAYSIGRYAFNDYTNLKSITIPDSVTSIGQEVFSGCTGLTSITIPDSVTSIGSYTFNDCINLTSVILSNNLIYIRRSFENCCSLESIVIPDSVIGISNNAFDGCTACKTVTIGRGVEQISRMAFSGCYSLGNIYMYPTIPPTLADINAIPTTATIRVPVGSGEAYRNATNWSYYSSRIVEDAELS